MDADVREPEAILEAAAGHLDFARQVAVVIAAVLHFLHDDAEVARIIEALRRPLVPGSYVMISRVRRAQVGPTTARRSRYAACTGAARPACSPGATAENLLGWFAGLDVLDPGVVPVQQ